jgi:hypothetical protein
MKVIYRGPRRRLVIDGVSLWPGRETEITQAQYERISDRVDIVKQDTTPFVAQRSLTYDQ